MQEGQQSELQEPAGVPQTGDQALDAVLATVAGLDDRPLDEHAAVFETAQERLRHALDVTDQG